MLVGCALHRCSTQASIQKVSTTLPRALWEKRFQSFCLELRSRSCRDIWGFMGDPQVTMGFWVVVWNMNFMSFPSYWECHHPNCYSLHHFSEGYVNQVSIRLSLYVFVNTKPLSEIGIAPAMAQIFGAHLEVFLFYFQTNLRRSGDRRWPSCWQPKGAVIDVLFGKTEMMDVIGVQKQTQKTICISNKNI